MRLFQSLDISGSALTAERLRLDLVANNLANINTTRAPEGGPYHRQYAVLGSSSGAPFEPRFRQALGTGFRLGGAQSLLGGMGSSGQGVRVLGIHRDDTAPQIKYEPNHPDADEDGYVAYPNVDVVAEMVDMLSATRSYEANVTAFNAGKEMAVRALDLGR